MRGDTPATNTTNILIKPEQNNSIASRTKLTMKTSVSESDLCYMTL